MAAALETRAAHPSMQPVLEDYLAALDVPDGAHIVDIGAGTGGVTRQIAARFPAASVLGVDPSVALTEKAVELAAGLANLSFAVGDGAGLDLAEGSADIAILHTVLSHVPDPAPLLAEAARILRPGGTLVICDADFSKASMASVPGDPLGSSVIAFVDGAVTDPWLTGKLRPLVRQAAFTIEWFTLKNRVVTEGMGSLVWVRMSGAALVARGVIGQPLADALEAEYVRRAEAGDLYSFLPFATL
ncbi:MAG: methyltransferase domain-containing protein, partial [Pseudomonadota bacterium]